MNKQELQNEINKTKEHLANMEKMLAECEYERWKPKKDELFYLLDSTLEVLNYHWYGCEFFKAIAENYGCFQTREQAEAEAEKILVRRMLEDIARRLNKGRKLNWNNKNQYKYSFYVDTIDNEILWCRATRCKNQGTVYCLDINFYIVAIQEIGEERLKKYLRGE